MSKSHSSNIAIASEGTTQGIADPKCKVCVAKLCFFGQLGPGLPPEKDYFKIGPVGVQLLSVKVSYLQYLWCFGLRRKE